MNMDRKTYENALHAQCMSIPALCEDQIAGVIKGLKDTIPADVLKNCRRVLITGCGDSYLAARAAIPAFRKLISAFGNHFEYFRAIELSRLVAFDPRQTASTVVIAVSASGGPHRNAEALQRAREKGCHTVALTNKPESLAAQTAEYSLIVNTPAFPNASPGLRNYYASLIGLYAFAAYMGEAKGLSAEGTLDGLFGAIREFTGRYAKVLDSIDEQMFELAQKWKDFKKFESIADDINYCSAYFIGAKFVEVAGIMTATMDAEDWCHVNFFAHDPEHIGTIVVASKGEPDRSRIAETVHQAYLVGRPVLVIADGTKEEMGIKEDVEFVTVPETPAGYEFMGPLLNYLPGAILASYVAALNGEVYFRRFEGSPHVASTYGSSIGTSKIEIV